MHKYSYNVEFKRIGVFMVQIFLSLKFKGSRIFLNFSFVNKPTFLERGPVLVGLCPKGLYVKKIRGAQQKSGLKPPPLGVDSPILANFLQLIRLESYGFTA